MNKIKFMPDLLTGRLNEYDAKRYFARVGWFAFTYFMLYSSIVTVGIMVTATFFPSAYESFLFSELLSVIPSYAIALPIAYQLLRPLPSVTPDKEKMKVSHWFCGLSISVALMIAGSYISNIILAMFSMALGGNVTAQNPVTTVIESTPLWATILFVVILAPILEELLFRKILCKRLLLLGEGYAIIIPSAIFALCHGNFFQIFYAFTLGCFFSFIYVRTGKLHYTILYHMAINLLGTVISPFVLSKIDLDALSSGSFSINAGNILPLLGFLWYEVIIFGSAIFGIALIVKNYKSFKPQSGLLPPPERRGVTCVVMNAGTAAAIAVFAFTLLGSLFT